MCRYGGFFFCQEQALKGERASQTPKAFADGAEADDVNDGLVDRRRATREGVSFLPTAE